MGPSKFIAQLCLCSKVMLTDWLTILTLRIVDSRAGFRCWKVLFIFNKIHHSRKVYSRHMTYQKIDQPGKCIEVAQSSIKDYGYIFRMSRSFSRKLQTVVGRSVGKESVQNFSEKNHYHKLEWKSVGSLKFKNWNHENVESCEVLFTSFGFCKLQWFVTCSVTIEQSSFF